MWLTEGSVWEKYTLTPDERERLFAHGMHEEGVFYNRLNFFLVFESVLFAATLSGFSGKDAPPRLITIPICILGVIVSLIWWYAQVNKLRLLHTLENRIEEHCDEFKETIRLSREHWIVRISWSASTVLAHVVPPTFMACWLYLILYSTWLRTFALHAGWQ